MIRRFIEKLKGYTPREKIEVTNYKAKMRIKIIGGER